MFKSCIEMKCVVYYVCLLLPAFVLGSDIPQDVLLCRQCGHEILLPENLSNIKSPLALSHRNDSVIGVDDVLVQLVQTTDGDIYEIITSTQADAYVIGEWLDENTWYPEHYWKIGVCPHCGTQLGWVFRKNDLEMKDDEEVFMALIMHMVISRNFADSLLVVPNLYR